MRSEHASQQAVYDSIIRNHREYPYTTADWAVRAYLNHFRALPQHPLIFEIGANTGESAQVLAKEQPRFLPDKQLQYVGVDISPVAIGLASEKAAGIGNINAQFFVADGLAPDASSEVVSARQNADLIIATYVGPSVGLRNIVEKLAQNGRPFALIDRVYAPEQAESLALKDAASSAIGFMKFFHSEGIPFPVRGFLKQMSQKLIYSDPDYQRDVELYSQNAPGELETFQDWISSTFDPGQAHIRARFGTDTVMIEGNQHR